MWHDEEAIVDRWRRIHADPEVVAAQEAFEAWDKEEKELSLALGRALRRAQKRVEEEDEHAQH